MDLSLLGSIIAAAFVCCLLFVLLLFSLYKNYKSKNEVKTMKLQTMLHEAEDIISQLEQGRKEKDDRLKKAYDNAALLQKDNEDYMCKLNDAMVKIAKLQNERDENSKKVTKSVSEKQKLIRLQNEHLNTINKNQEQIVHLQKECNNLLENNKEMKEKNKQLHDKIEEQTKKYQQTLEEFTADKSKIKVELKENQQKLEEMRAEKSKNESELKENKQKLEEMRAEKSKNENELKESRQKLEEMRAEKSKNESELKENQQKLEEMRAEKSQMENKLNKKNKELSEDLNDAVKKIGMLRQERNQYRDNPKNEEQHITFTADVSMTVPTICHDDDRNKRILEKMLTTLEGLSCHVQISAKESISPQDTGVIIPCIAASRVESDVEAVFSKLNLDPSVRPVLLVVHPQAPHNHTRHDPNRIHKKFPQCVTVLNALYFNEDFYECDTNKKFFEDLKQFLVR